MNWTIHYYSDAVLNSILDLPPRLKARYFRLTDLMQEHGSNLGNNNTKKLRDDIFELRLRGEEGIARVLYCTLINQRIMILHSFIKKTQKTPKKEIDIALERLREVKQNDDT